MSQEYAERSPLDRSVRKRVSGRTSRIGTSRFPSKEDDLTAARSKLDSLLESIAKGEETYEDDYFDDETSQLSPVKSKRSRGQKKTRKRTREDDYSKSSMFILKLFDRTVDLSEFCSKYIDSDPPLYPICRAWARNSDNTLDNSLDEDQLTGKDYELEETSSYGGPDKPTGLYILPNPDPLPIDENGDEIDLRLPKSIIEKKDPCVELIDESINCMAEETRESLLESNICQWKIIRQQWREAAAINQARYKPSFNVIQALSTVPSQGLDDEMLSAI